VHAWAARRLRARRPDVEVTVVTSYAGALLRDLRDGGSTP
jgi:hypothetical protein